jgi:hypothetical protein
LPLTGSFDSSAAGVWLDLAFESDLAAAKGDGGAEVVADSGVGDVVIVVVVVVAVAAVVVDVVVNVEGAVAAFDVL